MSEEGKDPKRKFPRIETQLISKIKRLGTTGPDANATIKNLSKGGALMEMPVPVNVGDVIQFNMTLPGSSTQLEIKGVVRWLDATHSDHAGIEFIEIKTPDKSQLHTYIDRKSKREAPPEPEKRVGVEVVQGGDENGDGFDGEFDEFREDDDEPIQGITQE